MNTEQDGQCQPRSTQPDPEMFAALTGEESDVLRAHLTSGWYKQHVAWPRLSDGWWETAEILDDIHVQRMAALDAEKQARTVRAGQAEAEAG